MQRAGSQRGAGGKRDLVSLRIHTQFQTEKDKAYFIQKLTKCYEICWQHGKKKADMSVLLSQLQTIAKREAAHRPRGELIISNKILSLDFEARFKSSQQISLKDHSYFFHNLASEAHLEISEKNKEFADITLACEDGQQMEAHRVILASPNPLFQVLLSWNNHAHPLIYLRGMIFHDLARFALKTTWFEHQHTSLARASLNMGNITNN